MSGARLQNARAAADSAQRTQHYQDNWVGMSAYERHKLLVSDYLRYFATEEERKTFGTSSSIESNRAAQLRQTDVSALKSAHRFIRSEDDDAANTWEVRLAKRYYERLFKEYCIADLSRYKESKLGLRWRTEKEVVAGKGQFVCGAKGCDSKEGLCSYEVNFAYVEAGARKQALVKLRCCPACAYKLNYKKEKAFRKAQAKAMARQQQQAGADGGAGGGPGSGGGRKRAADFFDGADGGAGAKEARHGHEQQEGGAVTKEWVVPPPGREQQQQQGYDPGPPGAAGGAGQPPQAQQSSVLSGDDRVWETKPVQEATAEEEFDQYLDAMFI